ncbi:MAG: hypothetical protein ACKVTZ_20755 [Bacteroidia bacterium]
MFTRFYGACALAVALLTSCGGEKAENKTEKKEEAKTEASEKKTEAEDKPEAPKTTDLSSQLIGEWELKEAFDPGGEKMKNVKASLTFTKAGYTQFLQFPDQPAQNIKGTWTFDAQRKNEDAAIDCLLFNSTEEGEMGWNLMSVTDTELVLVFTTMPEKRVYKRK